LVPTLWISQANQPLSWEELKQLILLHQQGTLAEDRILYLIAEKKVGFSFDQSVERTLKQWGASRLILEAVANHGRVSGRTPEPKTDAPGKGPSPQSQSGASSSAQATDPYTLSVDVDLVNVNVVVTDASGKYLTHLQKENFRIYEDRVEQQITHFSPVDAPFAVGLLLDTSYSTVNKLARIQDEAIHFVGQIHVDDEVMVVSFDDEVHLDSDFTRNKRATERAIKRTRTGQETQLYEAVYLALDQKIRRRRERKALVLFTDGVDTASRTSSLGETVELAKEADTLIYPIFFDTRYDVGPMFGNPRPRIGLGDVTIEPTPPFPRRRSSRYPRGSDPTTRDYRLGRRYLQQLAKITGGTFHVSKGLHNLGHAFQQIAAELRNQYSLAYSPTNNKKNGKFRKIKIVTDLPDVIVRARRGYYSRKS
jgi:VWFA-related protein